jgi:hypothetical protein
MSYNASYWFARGYYDGRSNGESDFANVPEEQFFSYESGFIAGCEDYNEFDESAYDGQPDEAQEWHDFDPDC